mmetsp:Transcript_16237/g.54424  ORF Transcript_16237/g.54424 Transcript_16237/m.54424 type:complete len:98 (+) Transcript_16237:2064-2357(+)
MRRQDPQAHVLRQRAQGPGAQDEEGGAAAVIPGRARPGEGAESFMSPAVPEPAKCVDGINKGGNGLRGNLKILLVPRESKRTRRSGKIARNNKPLAL